MGGMWSGGDSLYLYKACYNGRKYGGLLSPKTFSKILKRKLRKLKEGQYKRTQHQN